MERYEFSYPWTAELGDQAMLCVIQRRGGRYVGPVLLVALPLLVYLLANDPRMQVPVAILGGAAIMMLLLFLLANLQRRRVRERWYRTAGDHTVHVLLDDRGLTVRSAVSESHVAWAVIHRMLANRHVALLFYQGWTYFPMPLASVPPGALEMVRARIAARGKG